MALRFYTALAVCSAGIVLCFAAAGAHEHVSWSMCEEVAHEVNNAYIDGLIDEKTGRRIIDRCFEQTS